MTHVDTFLSSKKQKMETPKVKPAPHVEFDFDRSVKFAKRMNARTVEFLCTVEWSWSPANERMESYYLQRRRNHWILWVKHYDDNYGRWEPPIAIAQCLGDRFGEKNVAMILLAGVLAEEIRQFDPELDRFGITNTGLLSMEELNAVADTVWGRSAVSDGTGEETAIGPREKK